MFPSLSEGVPTHMNVISEFLTCCSISVDPIRFLVLIPFCISSSSPGSNIGDFPLFRRSIFSSRISKHTT